MLGADATAATLVSPEYAVELEVVVVFEVLLEPDWYVSEVEEV
jgi:hypothetical protein